MLKKIAKPTTQQEAKVIKKAQGNATQKQEENVQFGQKSVELTPVAAALRTFQQVSTDLGLKTKDKLAILGLKHTKFFVSLNEASPNLSQDSEDRLGYFLVIVDLAASLVGDAGDWLRNPNHAPLFGGKPPIDLVLAGRIEGLFATLNYLRSSQGGWA